MKEWFTADCHLGHANILKYCGRTRFMTKKDRIKYERVKILVDTKKDQAKQRMLWFKFHISKESLDKMDRGLINNWNERVKSDDLVYHVGDFCFRSHLKNGISVLPYIYYESKLNGKIIFIKGSHDQPSSCKTNIEGILIKVANKQIYLVHDPRHINFNYTINLTAHCHKLWKFAQFNKNKGIDKWGAPIRDTEIVEPIKGQIVHAINVGVDCWEYQPVDINKIFSEYWRWRNKVIDNVGR